MKQYTNESQTAKLIELGFNKPPKKGLLFQSNIGNCLTDLMLAEENYCIGELMQMLLHKPYCGVSIYNVGLGQHKVLFNKLINRKFKVLFRKVGCEPIDLLFDCIVKLKEDGLI